MQPALRRQLCLLPWFAVALALSGAPAAAHSFNVALIVPLSGANAEDGGQMREGFMLAARERDAHAGQESDGHLGGLDVYVYPADSVKAAADFNGSMPANREIDIVAVSATEEALKRIAAQAGDMRTVVIRITERTPLSGDGGAAGAAAAFIAAFRAAYGYDPGPAAAQGYRVARRIDEAVRAQAGVDDRFSLAERFRRSEKEFTW